MRILILSQRVPYPPNRGDKITTFHYVRHLANQHEVSIACLADGADDLKNAEELKPIVHRIEAVLLSPMKARIRALCALTHSQPLTIAYFNEPRLHARVRRMMMEERFDAAVVCGSGVAQFVESFDDFPRVIQFADLDSQKWRLYTQWTRPPKKWIYSIEANRLHKYEQHLARTFSRSLVCSTREAEEFQKLIPGSAVDCVPNGVDLNYFQPAESQNQKPNSLIFCGVMNYRPNVDGVDWFCKQVLPLIRKVIPGVSLTICGSSPDQTVQSLQDEPGVSVTGAVPDVRPYMARSEVAVVPLRIARGIQNKLLEAMAMGMPSVATTAAWKGIDAKIGRDLFVEDNPTEFANAVIRLLKDRQLRQTIGQAARSAVEADYRWEDTLAKLDDILESVCARQGAKNRNRRAAQAPQHCSM